jgi:hypothetical protein
MPLENGERVRPTEGAPCFFFRSPLRSGFFVVNVILFAAVVSLDTAVIFFYWHRLSGPMAYLLFFIGYPGAACLMIRAWRRHASLNELYMGGSMPDASPDSPLGVALETAAVALNDGLFYTLTMMLVFLWCVVLVMRRGRF